MSAVATATNTDSTQNTFVVDGVVTLTGNYGGAASHGDTFDLSQLGIATSGPAITVDFDEQSPAGAAPSGNVFRYMPGTTLANGVLSVFSGAGVEYTQASAYGTPPFAIVGFKLHFKAIFPSI